MCRSGKAYETLRSPGCLHIPSQRTLRDYTHYVQAEAGFSHEVDAMLYKTAKVDICPERVCVALLDERHIREDNVYDKHSSWPCDQLCQPWRGQQTPRFTQPGCSEIQWELFKKVLKNQSPGKETIQVVYSQYPDFICNVVIPIL